MDNPRQQPGIFLLSPDECLYRVDSVATLGEPENLKIIHLESAKDFICDDEGERIYVTKAFTEAEVEAMVIIDPVVAEPLPEAV